jgi:hypothetical protein
MTPHPDRCPICGYYLTMAVEFSGCRCVDPAHWQAAGVLTSRDYYPMAKIMSWANRELKQRQSPAEMLNLSCQSG